VSVTGDYEGSEQTQFKRNAFKHRKWNCSKKYQIHTLFCYIFQLTCFAVIKYISENIEYIDIACIADRLRMLSYKTVIW